MADLQIGNNAGLTVPSGNNREGALNNPNLGSIALMKASLQDHDEDLYTDEHLNLLTYNDLVYAIRVNELDALPVVE